jgi:hypothetical protein
MYRWMETQCFIDDTVEEGAVTDIRYIKVRLGWLDSIDLLAEFGLKLLVLAQLIRNPSECCSSGVASGHDKQTRIGIQLGRYLWLLFQ